MATKRKVTNYSEEFRKSSAKLATDSDKTISVIAEELGLNMTTLSGWVKRYYPKSSDVDSNVLEKVKQLRKEVVRLKQERDILKKAAAYFANEMK